MVATAIKTQGTVLKRGDGGSPETFTNVGQLQSWKGPGGSAKVIDITNLDSEAKEKSVGLPDEGQISFELNLNPADTQQSGMASDRKAGTLRNFKLVLADVAGTTLTFAGYVLEFSITGQKDDVVKATATIEISGAVGGFG